MVFEEMNRITPEQNYIIKDKIKKIRKPYWNETVRTMESIKTKRTLVSEL
jgi:hypothetical protein